MEAVKLNSTHGDLIKPIFFKNKFMGVSIDQHKFPGEYNLDVPNILHNMFCNTYLSDNKQFVAYGLLDDSGICNSLLSFYESHDDASWYWTHIKTMNSNSGAIKVLLDIVMEHNERNGRFKFYSMFPLRYRNSYRRLAFSNTAKERYDYFDEYMVESKNQAKFTLVWQILYNRTLLPPDTIVRCTFLKQKYRTVLWNGGGL